MQAAVDYRNALVSKLRNASKIVSVSIRNTHSAQRNNWSKRRNYKQGCETGGGEIDVVVDPLCQLAGQRPWLGGGLNTVDARWLDFKKQCARGETHESGRLTRALQDGSIRVVNSRTAGATGGARDGSPRHSRIFRVASGG